MTKRSRGPHLVFIEKRRAYYIQWATGDGRMRQRSTGTSDQRTAEATLDTFLTKEFPDISAVLSDNEIQAARAPRFVYFIGGETGPIKIGFARNPVHRLADLQCGSPVPLKLLASAPGDQKQEWGYHNLIFAKHRIHGEWFDRHPDILSEIDRINGEVSK